jgi:hypothetical protein
LGKSSAKRIRHQGVKLLLGYPSEASLLAAEFPLLPPQLSLLPTQFTLPSAEFPLLNCKLGCLSRSRVRLPGTEPALFRAQFTLPRA